ncbi:MULTISPECIES: hypothetical protein [Methylobacterium]|jgi:hypothetical protein|uniref:Uncharacterized protein n=1 Tax=Methylobacterium hispanicum TaxID=270350 RepID=A0AAV4ZQF2_9HYPH|nr:MULTISPECIES: hypothetical protein [Methylobacterium]GJD90250.1 hypothetical protein BHAOGJBA_3787 [Methylobacterium hispanicum]
MRTVKLRPEPVTLAQSWEMSDAAPGGGATDWPLPAIHPWIAFLLEPWLQAIEQAGPGTTHWLQETSAAMSACLREWVDPTPAIERALEGARAASDLLVACIGRAGWAHADAQRQVARAAMGALIEALSVAEASESKAEIGLGF